MEKSEKITQVESGSNWFSFAQFPYYVAAAYLISLISPSFSNLIGDLKGKVVLLSVWLFCEIVINGFNGLINVVRSRVKELIFLFLWLFVLVFYKLYEIGDMETWLHYFQPLVYFITAYILGALYFDRFRTYKGYLIIVFLVVCGTSIFIIKLLYEMPFIVRFVKSGMNILDEEQLPIIGSINYFTGITLSIPFMIGILTFFKGARYKLISLSCLLIPFLLSIYLSTMTAPLFFSVFAVSGMLYFYYRYEIVSRRIVLSFVFLLFITIFNSMTINLEQSIFSTEKVRSILIHSMHGEVNQIARGSDAEISIDSFSKHPFLGVGLKQRGRYDEVGEHSTWIDALAEFGIIGFLPFLLFLYFSWKRICREFRGAPEQIFNQARLVSFILYILTGLFNPWGFDTYSAVFFGALVLGPSSTTFNNTVAAQHA